MKLGEYKGAMNHVGFTVFGEMVFFVLLFLVVGNIIFFGFAAFEEVLEDRPLSLIFLWKLCFVFGRSNSDSDEFNG